MIATRAADLSTSTRTCTSTETGNPGWSWSSPTGWPSSKQPMIEHIRKNVIVLINPVAEPDGRDEGVEWFYRYLKGRRIRQPSPSRRRTGHYVFHDNNRDTHSRRSS